MNNIYKIIKSIILLVPLVISTIVLIVVLVNVDGNISDLQAIEIKIDMGIAIIGIAISVWVGLNLYNLVEKKQVDELNELTSRLKKDIEEITPKIKEIMPKIYEFEQELKKEGQIRSYIIDQQNWFNALIQYRIFQLNPEKNISAIYHSIESFINSFEQLIDSNKKLVEPNVLEYSIFLNTLIWGLLFMNKYRNSLIGIEDKLTKISIEENNVDSKISESIDLVYQIIIDEKEGLIKCLKNKKYGVNNFTNLISGFEELCDDIIAKNSKFDTSKINIICDKIKDIIEGK